MRGPDYASRRGPVRPQSANRLHALRAVSGGFKLAMQENSVPLRCSHRGELGGFWCYWSSVMYCSRYAESFCQSCSRGGL